MGLNLGSSKITFFLLKLIFGMNVKSLKTLANCEDRRDWENHDLMVNQ